MLNIRETKNTGNTVPRPGMRMGQASAGLIAGYDKKYFRMPHNHHPQIHSLLEEFYRENPTVFEKNISFRLRSSEQFLPEALATHIAFKKSRAIVENRLLTLLLKMEKISPAWLKFGLALPGVTGRFAFGCIQSLDMAPPKTREIIMKWVNKRIGPLSENLHREYTP